MKNLKKDSWLSQPRFMEHNGKTEMRFNLYKLVVQYRQNKTRKWVNMWLSLWKWETVIHLFLHKNKNKHEQKEHFLICHSKWTLIKINNMQRDWPHPHPHEFSWPHYINPGCYTMSLDKQLPTAWPWRWKHYNPSKCQQPCTIHNGIISHKTWPFNNTTVKTSNLAQ
jgi:hypothetical protein